ncbi:MAG TPA: hypothetical protein VLL52_13680 [Anaerolineae bacterium]|nr:hypothetical protein [Anaerolineae bacterium]
MTKDAFFALMLMFLLGVVACGEREVAEEGAEVLAAAPVADVCDMELLQAAFDRLSTVENLISDTEVVNKVVGDDSSEVVVSTVLTVDGVRDRMSSSTIMPHISGESIQLDMIFIENDVYVRERVDEAWMVPPVSVLGKDMQAELVQSQLLYLKVMEAVQGADCRASLTAWSTGEEELVGAWLYQFRELEEPELLLDEAELKVQNGEAVGAELDMWLIEFDGGWVPVRGRYAAEIELEGVGLFSLVTDQTLSDLGETFVIEAPIE